MCLPEFPVLVFACGEGSTVFYPQPVCSPNAETLLGSSDVSEKIAKQLRPPPPPPPPLVLGSGTVLNCLRPKPTRETLEGGAAGREGGATGIWLLGGRGRARVDRPDAYYSPPFRQTIAPEPPRQDTPLDLPPQMPRPQHEPPCHAFSRGAAAPPGLLRPAHRLPPPQARLPL